MAELIDMALTDQALIDPTELLGDASELGWRNETFVHPGDLLGAGVAHTEYRAPNGCSRRAVVAMSSCNVSPVK